MKKIIILTLLILISFLEQSCNDDYMQRVPKTEISAENFFNSNEDLQMYINSLINWVDFNSNTGIFIEFSDDAYTTANVEIKNIMTRPANSTNITAGWNWDRLRQINFFLENFSKADIPQEDLNHFEGVARFHRARFYMEKVQRFSDVPWYDKVLTTDDPDLYKPTDPREFVVEKIFEDYQFAAEHVRPGGDIGEVTKWVVKTFMARHALYEGTFRKYHDYLGLPYESFLEIAKNQSLDVIENGGFQLYSTGNPNSDYGSLFCSFNLVGNPEVILLNRSIEGEKNSNWAPYAWGHIEQSPTRDLMDAFLMADGTYYSQQPDINTKSYIEQFEGRDPRLPQVFTYPGWEINNPETTSTWILLFQPNFTGYQLNKWFVNAADRRLRLDVDLPVLRYAEVLLIYAEARTELEELTQNDLDITINQLRTRAGMPPLNMNPPVDPIQEARYPNISSSTSQWKELLEIRRERRVELTHESKRFNDLMRYRAGHLLENNPEGVYFPSLGNHDLTGDGYPDIKLIPYPEQIPPEAEREVNEIGQMLRYNQAGEYGSNATVLLEHGDHGKIQVTETMGTFEDPKHYYRPIPRRATEINPNLEQIFGWE
jgi:starch-binding outer membrane protein, SusD/RagB family